MKLMDSFENRAYWNYRYASGHSNGSGVGSQAEYKLSKHIALAWTVALLQPNGIIDIGCGDMSISQLFPAQNYIGIDISRVVIERNRNQFPAYDFIVGDFLDIDVDPADLMVSIDVLIHQPSAEIYHQFVQKLVALANKGGVVGAFDSLPGTFFDHTTFFHEPISQTLFAAGVKHIVKLGEYRETGLFLFLKDHPTFPELDRLIGFLHFNDLISEFQHGADKLQRLERRQHDLNLHHDQVLTLLTEQYRLILNEIHTTQREVLNDMRAQKKNEVNLLRSEYEDRLVKRGQNFLESTHQQAWVAAHIPWRILAAAMLTKIKMRFFGTQKK